MRYVVAAAVAGTAALVAGLAITPPAFAAALTEVTNFGTNPSNLRMYEYVPDRVAAQPAILVAVHYCGGSGPAMHSGTEFASLADQYGFIVVYPSTTRSSNCFDVSSPQALHHDGGSDPVGIMSMVRYAEQHHNGDPNRVYVTGISSGAMMTNVLLGDYPDVFKAGAAFAGVPFGCFATTDGSEWNSACANGQVSKTPQEWGDLVRGAYPGYTGPRPRMQLWHGTADTVLYYPNFGEAIKQWTNVAGLNQTPALTDNPQPTWTRTRYGGTGDLAQVEAISMRDVTHNLMTSGMAARAVHFFGLDSTGPSPSTSPSSPAPSTSSSSPAPSGNCRVAYTMNPWNTGFTAGITITNTASTPVDGWSLTFTLPSGQTITGGWNATYAPASGSVTARNAAWNAVLAAGGSTDIGLQGTHTGNTAKPASFALNGTACAVA
jgi:poly(hydroxyalkanoate) depolymerase family esterase